MNRKAEHQAIRADNWDHELDVEPKFVGRTKDLELLLNALNGPFRHFGIFGIRAVGKSRLVKELLTRYVEYSTETTPIIIRIDLLIKRSLIEMLTRLRLSLGQFPSDTDTFAEVNVIQIKEYILAQREHLFIFFFDNFENAEKDHQLHDYLVSLIRHLAYHCENVKIFITSTTKFMSHTWKRIYIFHELLPLRPSESAALFKIIAPNIDLGMCEGPIVKLSEGLPLLISMIANELADDDEMITPSDMVNMLTTNRLKCLSRQDYYADEDRIGVVYRRFIERLQPKNIQRLAQLGYIPGPFDTKEAKQLLGFKADQEVEDQVLIPIRRRYMLAYDAQTRRFNIQGILRECLEVYFAIRNLSDVRMKFVKVFSKVMSDLCLKFGTTEYVKAVSQFSLEQPNFQKLLTEVYYTTEDTYMFFITIATSCTELIEQFMLKECDKFYQGCLVMADRYGDNVDKAVVNIAVGSMWTNAKDNLVKGADYYKEALKVLSVNGNKLQLATVYQRLGWNLHIQGRNVEAVGYFQKSLNISQNGGAKFKRLALQSMNSLGVTHTVLGNLEEAESYHFTSLRRARAAFPKDHPSIAVIQNNIGVFFNAKGDSENALKCYVEGFEIKRKNKAPVSSLVVSISNVANENCSLRKYDNAHELLDEGFKILDSQALPSRALLALLCDTKGKLLMAEHRYREAANMFGKAADIREMIIPDHITYVETLVHLVRANACLGLYGPSIKAANKVLTLNVKAQTTMPQNSFIAECYEYLADVYMQTGNAKKYSETLNNLESELCRLKLVHIVSCNDVLVKRVDRQLGALREKRHDTLNETKITKQ